MSEAEEVQLHMKVVINKQKNKVLFAEVGSELTDVLLSFLLLPLGTIVKVLEQHYGDKAPVIGALNTLYNGVANLDSIHFNENSSKQRLLVPKSWYESELCKLRLRISCDNSTSSCSGESYDGVFTQSSASFIISDDLRVMPNMAGSVMGTLDTLGITVTDMDGAEMRDVTFGLNEIMALLKESLVSLNPLTALVFPGSRVILARKGHISLHQIDEKVISINSEKMNLKVMLQKSTNKLLFAQAGCDFINFLFGALTLPLGKVEWFLESNSDIRSIDNLHSSISEKLNGNHLRSYRTKDELFKPVCYKYSAYVNMYVPLNFSKVEEDYVRGSRMYMVSDDLTVAPLGMTSSISAINAMNISLSDVKEVELQVGLEEGLSILKVALTSTTALTDGLLTPYKLSMKKHPKQEN